MGVIRMKDQALVSSRCASLRARLRLSHRHSARRHSARRHVKLKGTAHRLHVHPPATRKRHEREGVGRLGSEHHDLLVDDDSERGLESQTSRRSRLTDVVRLLTRY